VTFSVTNEKSFVHVVMQLRIALELGSDHIRVFITTGRREEDARLGSISTNAAG